MENFVLFKLVIYCDDFLDWLFIVIIGCLKLKKKWKFLLNFELFIGKYRIWYFLDFYKYWLFNFYYVISILNLDVWFLKILC